MGRSILLLALCACGPRQLLGQAKRGIRAPGLALDVKTLPAALRAHAQAAEATRLVGLPSFRPGRQSAADLETTLAQACDVHAEAIGELDLATAEAPEGCRQRGHMSWTHACADHHRRVQWAWEYRDVRVECGEQVTEYDGRVALEIGLAPVGITQLWVIDLGALQSATYTYEVGGETVATALVLGTGEQRAALMWSHVGRSATRDLRCFVGRDRVGRFIGSYIEGELMAMFVPETSDKRAHYRLQWPPEAVVVEGCTGDVWLDFCLYPHACD